MKALRLAALVLPVLCLAPRHAQSQVSALLSGRVTDQTGASVQGATVTATSDDTGTSRSTVTNPSGLYELLALPIGHYSLRAKKAGFAQQIHTAILLVVGQDATVDFTLKIGEVTEQVKVEGDTELVNPTTQDISGLVGEKEVKALPLNGRRYDLLLTLNPGIVNFTWERPVASAFPTPPPATILLFPAIALSKISSCLTESNSLAQPKTI